MENNDVRSCSRAAQTNDDTSLLPSTGTARKDENSMFSCSTFEGMDFDEPTLCADTSTHQKHQTISPADLDLGLGIGSSLLECNDSSFIGLDAIDFPETWFLGNMIPDTQSDIDSQNRLVSLSPQAHFRPCPSAPDHDLQPLVDTSYSLEKVLAASATISLSERPLEVNLSYPVRGEASELSFMGQKLSQQPPVNSSAQPTKPLVSPFPTATKRKRRRLSESTREKAKLVRRVGACLRCRVYKEPCDSRTPCQNCVKRAESAKVFRQPCFREPLDNVIPFRLSNSSLGQTRATYPKLQWSNGDSKAVELSLISSFGPHDVISTIKFNLNEFTPGPRDKVDFEWISGGLVKTLKLPAYAILDIQKAYNAIETFLNQCQPHLETYITRSIEDEILKLTVVEAHRYAALHDNDIIRRALKIRVYAVRRLRVKESELEIPVIDDKECLHDGHRPLPRFLNYQVDIMMNFVIDSHRKVVLKRLKALVFGKDITKAWYEVFLLTYLLLSTIEYACQWQQMYSAKRKNLQNYVNVNFVTRSNLEEWEYSAEILIAHFRCIMRGQTPFSSGNTFDENWRRAGLDEHSITYVRRIISLVKGRGV